MQNKQLFKVAFCGKMGAGKTASTLAALGLLKAIYGDSAAGFVIKFAQPIYATVRAFHRGEKPRVFMQRLGDLARREFGDDIMEKIFEENFAGLVTQELPSRQEKYILIMSDDCRFIKEWELLKNLGFTIIKVEADDEIRAKRIGETFTNVKHRSETELLKIKPDFIINNNEDDQFLVNLTEEIKNVLEKACQINLSTQ